jgi:hypothetical protein
MPAGTGQVGPDQGKRTHGYGVGLPTDQKVGGFESLRARRLRIRSPQPMKSAGLRPVCHAFADLDVVTRAHQPRAGLLSSG